MQTSRLTKSKKSTKTQSPDIPTGNQKSPPKNTRRLSPSPTKPHSRTLTGSPSGSSEEDNLPNNSPKPKVSKSTKSSPKLSPKDYPLLSEFSSKNHNDITN
jgi:hypothetical protein